MSEHYTKTQHAEDLMDVADRYERNHIVDSDGFVRMLPKIGGPYYKFLENKYTTYGYLAAGADSTTTLIVHV